MFPEGEEASTEGEALVPSPSDNGAQAGATVEQEPLGGEGGAAEEKEAGDWRDALRSLAQEDPDLAKDLHSVLFETLPEEERKRFQPDAQIAERELESELRELGERR